MLQIKILLSEVSGPKGCFTSNFGDMVYIAHLPDGPLRETHIFSKDCRHL